MRISDWSSDVCSSDLANCAYTKQEPGKAARNTRQNHLTKLCFIPNRLTSLQSQLQEPRVRHHLPQKNQNADNPTGRQTQHPEDFLQRYYSPWWLHCNSACCVPAQSPPGSRSEERRVGKACVSTCRSGCSPYH